MRVRFKHPNGITECSKNVLDGNVPKQVFKVQSSTLFQFNPAHMLFKYTLLMPLQNAFNEMFSISSNNTEVKG